MADEVEGFVSVREPAWHSLGTVIEDYVSTTEMLRLGGLYGWDVRVEEVEVPEGYYSRKPQYRTVRNSPIVPGNVDILGYVGERYHPYQNEELFSFGDALLDGGNWETAGSLRGGTRVFGSLALHREVTVGGEDRVNSFLLVSTSHDGTAAIQASVTPIRVVCMNTLNIALREAKQTFKIKHTKSMSGKVQAAREALGLADEYLDAWTVQMDDLVKAEFDNLQFERLVESIYKPKGDDPSKSAVTRYDKRLDILWDIWLGDNVGNFHGTKYGAYNALNEELNWFRSGRGDNAEENIAASRSGFNKVWNDENKALFEAVKAA